MTVANLNDVDISHCRAPRQHRGKRRPASSVGEGGRPGGARDGEIDAPPRGITCRVGPALSLAEVLPVQELIEQLGVLGMLPDYGPGLRMGRPGPNVSGFCVG